jgi:CRISPR-associated protein Cmr2
LLKRAKRRCAEEEYRTGALDFMAVTAAGSSDLNTLREEVLTQESFVFPHGGRKIGLTQRPYTLSQARTLLRCVRAFKKARFPRSQLQYLYEGLFHSQADAIYRWVKVGGRIGKEQRDALDEFYRAFGDGDQGLPPLPPWRRDNNPPRIDHTTALADLIEIYQFVSPE